MKGFQTNTLKTRMAFLAPSLPVCAALFSPGSFADVVSGTDIQRRQAQQLEQAQSRFPVTPDNLSASDFNNTRDHVLVKEDPCFAIHELHWDGDVFPWLAERAKYFVGQCLGAESLKRLRNYLNQSLLEQGWITTRVIFPQQNVSDGRLRLQFIPGRVSDIRHEGRSLGINWFPLAVKEKELINQFSLDQTLENYRRLPGQTGTSLTLLPGKSLGESALTVRHGEGRRWQGWLGLDNSGSPATGQGVFSGGIAIASPLGLHDNLTVYANRNSNIGDTTLGSRSTGAQWNMPLGRSTVSLSYHRSEYKQTVPGYVGPIVYHGESYVHEVGAGHMFYRSGSYKGQTQYKLTRKINLNYIDDVEILVQGRDAVAWDLSHTHWHQIGGWNISVNAGLKRSLPSKSKNSGVILGEPDWDGRYQVAMMNLNAGRAMIGFGEEWRFRTSLRAQRSQDSMPPSEYFYIGGRYSVRGFDGWQSLAAGSGGYWRNDIGLKLAPGHEAYMALDAGRVAGEESKMYKDKWLVGTALGVRGRVLMANYDLMLGWSLRKPDHFETVRPAVAASISFDTNE